MHGKETRAESAELMEPHGSLSGQKQKRTQHPNSKHDARTTSFSATLWNLFFGFLLPLEISVIFPQQVPSLSRGSFPILSRDPSFRGTIKHTGFGNTWFSKRTMVEKTGHPNPRFSGSTSGDWENPPTQGSPCCEWPVRRAPESGGFVFVALRFFPFACGEIDPALRLCYFFPWLKGMDFTTVYVFIDLCRGRNRKLGSCAVPILCPLLRGSRNGQPQKGCRAVNWIPPPPPRCCGSCTCAQLAEPFLPLFREKGGGFNRAPQEIHFATN